MAGALQATIPLVARVLPRHSLMWNDQSRMSYVAQSAFWGLYGSALSSFWDSF